MDRAEALELLRASHRFPGPYRFRVVVPAGRRAAVVTAIQALAGERLDEVGEQPSRKGTYISLRLTLTLGAAEEVLEVYDLIRAIDGVRAVM